ncbi:unnamed protein product [Soboliphyme baturini]|uniref:Arf-GAP domain-containing protein n=1 Tax=Soboliphyme baturini TaxID=241478 RepID=A0A183IDV4_9BILA|nr:unnamed protein product [Soboliphyme baturini]
MNTKSDKKFAEQQEKLQQILNDLLKDEENKYCADCEAKGPRWASWNLGVFLCIRCAGIHRNLGVHISKVKSVNLDTWTAQQVQYMRLIGNSTARAVYEANLPPTFRRPKSDNLVESFIKSKYVQKLYMKKGWVPPTVNTEEAAKQLEHELQSEAKSLQHLKHTKVRVTKREGVSNNAMTVKASVSASSAPNCSTPAEEELASINFGYGSFSAFADVSSIRSSQDSSTALGLNVIDLQAEGDIQLESSLSSYANPSQQTTQNCCNIRAKTDTQLLTPEPVSSNVTSCRKSKQDIMALYQQGSSDFSSGRPIDGVHPSFFSNATSCNSSIGSTSFQALATPSPYVASSADCLHFGGYNFDAGSSASGLPRSAYSTSCLPAPRSQPTLTRNDSSYDELVNSILMRRN